MKVDIVTLNQRNPRQASKSKQIDWSDSSDRKWLMNHLHWAVMNEHTVTLMPNVWDTARQSN